MRTGRIVKKIFKRHGVRGFFRGLPAMMIGAAPAHAVFFGAYEFTKHELGGNMAGHRPVETALAGIAATISMDAILTPMDAVKQRMQIGKSKYRSVADCLRKVYHGEGLGSLYAGYITTLIMNVPYSAFFFASYESYKIMLMPLVGDSEAKGHLTCGAAAGGTAAALTTPLDVVKTRLQTQHDTGKRYGGMIDAAKTIWREEGIAGAFKGVKPRLLLHLTSGAIVWSVYEQMKILLEGKGGE